MAEIKDCIGKTVKISKHSITIKNPEGKTCGVVRDIVSLYDMQPNKQIVYYRKLRQLGVHGTTSIKDILIKDNTIYVFRNIKSKLWHEKHGYFDEREKQNAEEKEKVYNAFIAAGIDVVECIYM